MTKDTYTYIDLQNTIDTLIGVVGLHNTISILRSVTAIKKISSQSENKIQKLKGKIISECIIVFELDKTLFYSSSSRQYKQARMTCFYLLRKYTDYTYTSIAKDFNLTKRQVIYYSNKLKSMDTIPHFHKPYYLKLKIIEDRLIEFITLL